MVSSALHLQLGPESFCQWERRLPLPEAPFPFSDQFNLLNPVRTAPALSPLRRLNSPGSSCLQKLVVHCPAGASSAAGRSFVRGHTLVSLGPPLPPTLPPPPPQAPSRFSAVSEVVVSAGISVFHWLSCGTRSCKHRPSLLSFHPLEDTVHLLAMWRTSGGTVGEGRRLARRPQGPVDIAQKDLVPGAC